ncbi:YIP1 family protein [Haloarcula salinisoli]|uniref:YIP1 family protein n=1 Tax=Haloarcula salinisoli TaxID=2487746 RepID=A0A8J7YN02_9EURY|nr:YIP1 family protein [Halomicroarcula salinisoli]MBX0305764.1 YIP1 family protein [Halomicroarcula salinisoli]
MPSTPLFAPDEFFSSDEFSAQRSPSLAGAAIILILTNVVAVASGVPYADQFPSEFTPEGLVFVFLIAGLIGGAALWTVLTVAVYLLTAIVGGTGSIARTAANIGWASLPLLLRHTILALTIWVLTLTGDAPPIAMTQMQPPSPLFLFNLLTGVIAYVWLGYLFTYAIRDARNLDIRRSAGVAGIVIMIPLLNTALSLFGVF